MLALFNRLKSLEDQNLRLEHNNEELRAKVWNTARPRPGPYPRPWPSL